MSGVLVLPTCEVDLAAAHALGPGGDAPLTPLEGSLLRHLAAAGGPVEEDRLLQDVWGYHPRARSRAVVHAVSRLRRKLGDDAQRPRSLVRVGDGYALVVQPAGQASASTRDLVVAVDGAHGVRALARLHEQPSRWLERARSARGPDAAWSLLAASAVDPAHGPAGITGALVDAVLVADDPALTGRLAHAACGALASEGLPGDALALVEAARARWPTPGPARRALEGHLAGAHLDLLVKTGDARGFAGAAAEARRVAVPAGDRRLLAIVCDREAAARRRASDLGGAWQLLLDAAEAASAHEVVGVQVRHNMGLVALLDGRLDDADALLAGVIHDLLAAGWRTQAGVASGNRGLVALRRGDRAAANALMDAAWQAGLAGHDRQGCSFAAGHLGRLAIEAGELGEAARWFDRALHIARDAGLAREVGRAALWSGWVAHVSGADPMERYREAWSMLHVGGRDDLAATALCTFAAWAEPGAASSWRERAAVAAVGAGVSPSWFPLGQAPPGRWDFEVACARRLRAALTEGRGLSETSG